MATCRALLVAVDDTDAGTAPIDGASADLVALRQWLVDSGRVRPEHVFVCAGAACADRTAGTRRDELVATVRRLAHAGCDATDVLWVFVVGRVLDEGDEPLPRPGDWLVPRDGDDGLVPLCELQRWLAWALGPGEHFWFVDARPAAASQPRSGTLGLRPLRSERGCATVHSLVALGDGAPVAAAVRDALADHGAPPGRDAWPRLVERLTQALVGRTVEARCGQRAPEARDGARASDPASRLAVEIGEQILRPTLPIGFGGGADASVLHVCATFRDPGRASHMQVRPARFGTRRATGDATHHRFDLDPAPQVLAIDVPGWPTLEMATCTVFGHATVVVLSDGDDGRLDVRQLVLPLPQLAGRLAGPLRQPTRALGFMTAVQRRLVRGLPLVDDDDEWERARWADLLSARWVDPVLSLIAAYDLIRRGARRHGGDGEGVGAIVRALRTRHPGLPDTDLIAGWAGMEAYPVSGWPLFVDGMLAVDEALRPAGASLRCDAVWTVFRRAPVAAARARLAAGDLAVGSGLRAPS